jgi:hypothetical protein
LRITDNELSVWDVHDDKTNLDRILTALSATRDAPSHIDYLIFNYQVPTAFNIQMKQSKGETPDIEANSLWHYDLWKLSARQVAEFAVEIHRSGVRDRLPEKRVKQLIIQGVRNKQLNPAKMKSNLVQKLRLGKQPLSIWGHIARFFWRTR